MGKFPLTLGLFEKRIEGDDCLMELARRRFREAGMGTEIPAATPEQLEAALRFRPDAAAPLVVHLPRNWNLADAGQRGQIENFARRFAGQVYGFVIHDHPDMAARPDEFVRAAREMDARLKTIPGAPWLFVEYAAGLELTAFLKFFATIRELRHISACVDTGHVGIRETRAAYARRHPGADVCAVKSQPNLVPAALPEIGSAMASALPAVLALVQGLAALGKPVHFHLHDGHPLSAASPFGVSDHLSFLAEIPLAFEWQGRRVAKLMYGPEGLAKIVSGAVRSLGAEKISFTLEIHPQGNQLPLGDAGNLFGHWRDLTNAEKMNAWLAALAENHRHLRAALAGVAI